MEQFTVHFGKLTAIVTSFTWDEALHQGTAIYTDNGGAKHAVACGGALPNEIRQEVVSHLLSHVRAGD